MADRLVVAELSLDVLTIDDLDELHAIFSDPATHTIGEGPLSAIEEAGFPVVWATIRPRNRPSIAALSRIGFVHDRTVDDDRGGLVYLYHSVSRS